MAGLLGHCHFLGCGRRCWDPGAEWRRDHRRPQSLLARATGVVGTGHCGGRGRADVATSYVLVATSAKSTAIAKPTETEALSPSSSRPRRPLQSRSGGRPPSSRLRSGESVKDRMHLGRHDGHGLCGVWGHVVGPRAFRPRPRLLGGTQWPSSGRSQQPHSDDRRPWLLLSGQARGRCCRSGRAARGPHRGRQHDHAKSSGSCSLHRRWGERHGSQLGRRTGWCHWVSQGQ
jgi:hypothetical protein